MSVLRRLLIVSAAGLVIAGPALAQSAARRRADSLLAASAASMRAGDTSEAVKQARAATQADNRYAAAHYEYGKLLARTTSLGFADIPLRTMASHSLNRAADLDNDNPWPVLELGRLRLKMPLLRIAAEALFQRALEIAERSGDSDATAEVRYELGRIYDLRFRGMANRYEFLGDVKMLDPYEAQYEKRYVSNFLSTYARPIPGFGEMDGLKAEEHYRAALALKPGHENAATSYAALLYESNRYSEMARVSRRAAADLPSSARVRLAEALALLYLGEIKRADAVFTSAVALMSDRERQMIASIAPLMKPQDARAFEALDDRGRSEMERLYWDAADPLLLTSMNEQYLAFMGRVAYADLFFSMPERGVRGALTDRGKIVLRYGEPPTVAVFAPDVTQNQNGFDTIGMLTTLWFYPRWELKFVFTGPPAMDGAWFTGDFRAYAEEMQHMMPAVFADIPYFPLVDTIPFQMARFRGNQSANTRVEFYASMPMRHLATGAELKTVPVETSFMIRDAALRGLLVDSRDTATVPGDVQAPTRRAWTYQFAPGEYVYRIEGLEPQAMRGARATGPMSVVGFTPGTFSVSDILVGRGLEYDGVEPQKRADVRVDVAADNALNPGEPLAMYWESYGARPDSVNAVSMNIELSLTVLELDRAPVLHTRVLGAIADRVGMSQKGERTWVLSYDRTVAAPPATDDRLLHTLTVQLDGAPPAQYLLELIMTDKQTGQTARTSRVFSVRRPE